MAEASSRACKGLQQNASICSNYRRGKEVCQADVQGLAAACRDYENNGASGIRVELKSKIKPSEVEEYCHPEPFPIPESTRHALNTLNARVNRLEHRIARFQPDGVQYAPEV